MKPTVAIDAFLALDLRVGNVLSVSDVPGSEKLYRMEVDLGSEIGTRVVYAGVKTWYPKEKLNRRKFVFIANLAPRRMPGGESQGMMLAIDGPTKPVLMPAPRGAAVGSILR